MQDHLPTYHTHTRQCKTHLSQCPFVPMSLCPIVPCFFALNSINNVIFFVKLLYSQFFFVFLHAEDYKTVYCQ